jgi:hypothetical protein
MDTDTIYLITIVLVMVSLFGSFFGLIFFDMYSSGGWESGVVVGVLDGVSAARITVLGDAYGFCLIVDGVEYPVAPVYREMVGSGVVTREFSFDELRGLVGEKVMLSYEINRAGKLRNGVLEVMSDE